MKTNKFFLLISMALLAMMTVGCNFPTVKFPGAALPEEVVISVPLREPTATPVAPIATATPTPACPIASVVSSILVGEAYDPQNMECPAIFMIEEGVLSATEYCEGNKAQEILAVKVARVLSIHWTWEVQKDGNWIPLLVVVYLDDQGKDHELEVNTERKFGR